MFVAVLAFAVLIPGKPLENKSENALIHDLNFKTQVSRSIVIIKSPHMIGMAKGSGIVITKTLILTAKHVVEESLFPPFIIFNEKTYISEDVHQIENTDAAFVLLSSPIEDARPIEWNLEVGENQLDAYAFGAWGNLTSITYSAGSISRKAERIDFLDKDLDWVMTGDTMLYFGFSGGALVDCEGRLLGISFGASPRGSHFIDIRPLHKMAFSPDLFK